MQRTLRDAERACWSSVDIEDSAQPFEVVGKQPHGGAEVRRLSAAVEDITHRPSKTRAEEDADEHVDLGYLRLRDAWEGKGS